MLKLKEFGFGGTRPSPFQLSKAETGRSLSLMLPWSTWQVPCQPGVHSEGSKKKKQ